MTVVVLSEALQRWLTATTTEPLSPEERQALTEFVEVLPRFAEWPWPAWLDGLRRLPAMKVKAPKAPKVPKVSPEEIAARQAAKAQEAAAKKLAKAQEALRKQEAKAAEQRRKAEEKAQAAAQKQAAQEVAKRLKAEQALLKQQLQAEAKRKKAEQAAHRKAEQAAAKAAKVKQLDAATLEKVQATIDRLQALLPRIRSGVVSAEELREHLALLEPFKANELMVIAKALEADAGLNARMGQARLMKELSDSIWQIWRTVETLKI